MIPAAIYEGLVVHQRRRPTPHRLAMRIPMMLLDIDHPDAVRARLFSVGRFNLFGFAASDHGDAGPLRPWVEGRLAAQGLIRRPSAILLLAMPRVLGRIFNPLSIYFCLDAEGAPIAMLYEVNNTFGERHVYVLPATRQGRVIRQGCPKAFFVSPFLPAHGLDYSFRIRMPGEDVSVMVTASDANGVVLAASFTGQRRPFTDRTLIGLLLRHGLLAAKVLAGIHLEAFKLWRKRIPLHARPARVDLEAMEVRH